MSIFKSGAAAVAVLLYGASIAVADTPAPDANQPTDIGRVRTGAEKEQGDQQVVSNVTTNRAAAIEMKKQAPNLVGYPIANSRGSESASRDEAEQAPSAPAKCEIGSHAGIASRRSKGARVRVAQGLRVPEH
jgi:hypothetical protein